MKTIALEEHFATSAFLDGPGRFLKENAGRFGSSPEAFLESICDIGDRRIAAMDAAGIDMQVLSLNSPGVQQLDGKEAVKLARDANELLAEAVRRRPNRFAGFAALPTADPQAAAGELERTIRDYGFKGALINGHTQGRYLDDAFFSPILERAEAMGVPIYLHPTPPPAQVTAAWYAGFSPALTWLLAGSGWGWHIETAVHVIRMIVGGVFDRFPRLQLVIGHLGEALPFMLPRLDVMPMAVTKLKHPVSAYLRENVHYTVSGFNWLPAFLDLLLQVGNDRIMFSADHPFGSMEEARAFLDHLPINPIEMERIAHGNAERLLRLS